MVEAGLADGAREPAMADAEKTSTERSARREGRRRVLAKNLFIGVAGYYEPS
jgi:hypothetical protein